MKVTCLLFLTLLTSCGLTIAKPLNIPTNHQSADQSVAVAIPSEKEKDPRQNITPKESPTERTTKKTVIPAPENFPPKPHIYIKGCPKAMTYIAANTHYSTLNVSQSTHLEIDGKRKVRLTLHSGHKMTLNSIKVRLNTAEAFLLINGELLREIVYIKKQQSSHDLEIGTELLEAILPQEGL